MPSAAFASGFLGSVFDTLQQERARRDQNSMFAAQYLLASGRVKNFNDLLPLIGDLFQSPLAPGGKGKAGGGGKGAKGGGLTDLIAKFVNPALAQDQQTKGAGGGGAAPGGPGATTLGGQARPSFPGAPAGGGTATPTPGGAGTSTGSGNPLYTEDEFQSKQVANRQTELDQNFEDQKRREGLTQSRQIAVEQAKAPHLQQKWVTVNGKTVAAGWDPRTNTYYDTDGNPIQGAVERPAPAGGALAERTRQVQAQLQARGITVDDAQASAIASKQLDQERVQKIQMQREALSLRQVQTKLATLDVPTAQSVSSLIRGVTVGSTSTPYLDLGLISGTKEKNAAIALARGNGIAVVTPKEADALASASAASANLQGFLDQIKDKLPADAAGRPLTALGNSLQSFFQTDADLATASAWDTTVIPMLRAISTSGIGRITNKELAIAEAARPKISDTVAVAARKVAIVEKILQDGINPVLQQGTGAAPRRPGGGAGAGGADAGAVPDAVTKLLKGKKPGPYTLSDGSTWQVGADGSIRPAKKAA